MDTEVNLRWSHERGFTAIDQILDPDLLENENITDDDVTEASPWRFTRIGENERPRIRNLVKGANDDEENETPPANADEEFSIFLSLYLREIWNSYLDLEREKDDICCVKEDSRGY
ncbi:hypothetical protein L1987_45748 [Smallanthus sonchifolius]|uniref:Uncharacterized protein n=1 Tax=Smallanthus sonchifolius TaxID=185202 RepID=A0ACB9FXQ5_9ASTR|nr:hypothetical protein L1987_45748 [Smallanthus sonchifolius]